MFKFLRMPFGPRNAGNTFQRMMGLVLGELPFCFVYMDDIIIFSKDLSSHLDNLREVFRLCRLCRKHGLTIGLPKCKFVISKIEFLGRLLSAFGCSPLLKHSAAISAFPPLSDKPALQRFLGMLNFSRKFLRGAAGVLAPLTDALRGPGKSLYWSPALDSAFCHAKDLLAHVPELVHPCSPGYFYLHHFRFLLECRHFMIFTDHKPFHLPCSGFLFLGLSGSRVTWPTWLSSPAL